MKKHSFGSRLLVLLLVLAMVLPMMPAANAAVGDLENVATGLTGDIDTSDTISLPIKIYDYENDGMLFEYAEAYANKSGVAAAKTAADFGAAWYEDYTIRTSVGGTINTGNYWSDVSLALKTGTYANYTRATWSGNTTATWTGNRAGVVLADFGTSSTYTTDQVRYMVVVFRSNVRSGNFTVGLNRANLNGAGTDGNYTGNIAVTTENNTNWTYAVLDLKTGTLGSNWSKGAVYGVYVGLPIDASGEWMDLAHVAFFANEDQAKAFGEYALTDGSDRGDNRGFGLLRSSRNQSGGTAFDSIIDDTTTVEQLNTYGSTTSIDFSSLTTLGYTLLGTFGEKGIANVGLLESTLSAEGYPVYKQEVVTYLANLLKHSLEIPERTSDGWKNYRYVKGTASDIYGGTDLATALRTRINGNMGSYAVAAGKDLVGTWGEVGGNIASYYDAAYFLLNSIFFPGSYNEVQDDYAYLVLSAGTDSATNEKVYVFDGGFSTSATPSAAEMAIDYNITNHTIQNTSAAGKAHFYYEGDNTTTLNPFLPITDRNTADGMTKSIYYQDDGVINGVKKQETKDTLYKRDFNFAMVSEGEFVYHADDELFFEFEGDDDVYLFINNELVMDIGSAHSIDSVRFNLNDYVNAAKAGTLGDAERNAALALEEAATYSFKFYYMERHSYGSNIRICTNIRVTDPSMETQKPAWQDGVKLDFGSIVDKDKIVEYGFSIKNSGDMRLYNLTFADSDIGVALDYENGLTVTGERVYDINGGTLEPTDLTAIVTHPDYDDITVTFDNNAALKEFLKELTDVKSGATEGAGGLYIGATVLFRGIGYKLSEDQIKAGVFDNTVLTTARTNKDVSDTLGKVLHGQATMRVFVPADPMYYQWAKHDLVIDKAKFIEDVLAAAKTEGNILAGKVPNLTTSNVNKIELVTKAGTVITSPYVTIDDSYNLTVNYTSAGSHVFYAKVTYNSSRNTVIVPVLVNTTAVKDSVFVLDYGLKAYLTEDGAKELFKNDAVTVPGRETNHGVLAVGSGGAYSHNEITFTSSDSVDGTYGDFAYNDGTITYTPDDFMNDMDTVQIAVNVYESDIIPSNITGTLDINNEVEMYKSVSVLPATVVYYEDDFPAIKYTDVENNFERIGGSEGNSQGIDQDENYGHDASYANDAEMSGDSLTKITIKQAGPVAQFTFKGTGFELLSRTNAYDSATIELVVKNEQDEEVRRIPVITEFDNGANDGAEEIYQVPVIRVDDLELNTYTVVIEGIPAYDWSDTSKVDWSKPIEDQLPVIPTILYIDGLRIYQPLGASNDNYTDDENGAAFTEVRDLIVKGQAAVAELNADGLTVGTATTTWTENRNGEANEDGTTYEGHEVNSVNDYLIQGPNNEVYMDGWLTDSALYFLVRENGTGTHSLQIGIHAVDVGLFNGAGETGMNAPVYYAAADDSWELLGTITSGTEQYYTIDYTNCPDTADGAYQIILKVDAGDSGLPAMASYTSIKTVGLDVAEMDAEAADYQIKNGMLEKLNGSDAAGTNKLAPDFQLLSTMLSTSVMAAPEQPVLPEPEEPAHPFVDVQEDAFYIEAMLWAVENGITNGTSATTFSPDKLVTRAETVTFLWRAAGEPEPMELNNPFVDVTENDFYYKAVLWAVENGITNGLDVEHFGPLTTCNRAQVVTFLYRAAGEPEVFETEHSFTDVENGAFYYNAMLWAVENGITNGLDAVSFGPNTICNRAQIVTFLYRAD